MATARTRLANGIVVVLALIALVAAGLYAATSPGLATEPRPGAAPATLVMIEEAGCPYCRRWHAQVGPAYQASPEGRFAPLLRMDIGAPERRAFEDVRFTPTFILVKGREEIGRIVGYPGEEFFWSLLGELLKKAGYSPPAGGGGEPTGETRTEAPRRGHGPAG